MLNKLVKIMVSEDIWGAITDDKVDALLRSEDSLNLLNTLLSSNVALDHRGAFNRSNFKEINRDEVRLAE